MTTKKFGLTVLTHGLNRGWDRIGLAGTVLGLVLAGSSALAQTPVSEKTRVSYFEYDTAGFLSKEVIEPDSADNCLSTTYGYDAKGNRIEDIVSACLISRAKPYPNYTLESADAPRKTTRTFPSQTVTDPTNASANLYSSAGIFQKQKMLIQEVTNGTGPSETYEFDPRHGQMTKLLGPNNLPTTWKYDGFGRKIQESRVDGTWTKWEYKLCQGSTEGICPASIGNDGIAHTPEWYVKETTYGSNSVAIAASSYDVYDTLGRLVRSRSDSFMAATLAQNRYPSIQDTAYNALGQVASRSRPYLTQGGNPYWSRFSYDALGRTTLEVKPGGVDGESQLKTEYRGLETIASNSLGQNKKTFRYVSGLVKGVEDAQGQTVVYGYDALGNVTSTNAAGSLTLLSYDVRGRKKSMQDPAMGRWDYEYNAFGELVWQKDSLSQVVTLNYDILGRMTGRNEPDLISNWYFDKKADGNACGVSAGKLCEATTSIDDYRRVHTYDELGRSVKTGMTMINGAQLTEVSTSYDAVTGRVKDKTWPTGFKAVYEYTTAGGNWTAGHLWKVKGMDGANQVALWQARDKDAEGRVVGFERGNGVVHQKTFDGGTDRTTTLRDTLTGQASGNVLSLNYRYDRIGNLKTRVDSNTLVNEAYSYDNLNRLSQASVAGGNYSGPPVVQVLYDARGNIKYKSDVGYYHYDAARPNRMTAITIAQENWAGATGQVTVSNSGTRRLEYAFDDLQPNVRSIDLGQGSVSMGNGNLKYTVDEDTATGSHYLRAEEYTSFNKIRHMRLGNLTDPSNVSNAVAERTVDLVYGPEHQRVKQVVTLTSNAPSNMEPGTTWYMNGEDSLGLTYEKEVKSSGLTEHKHYLSAGGEVFALFTQREGTLPQGKASKQLSYWHFDQLGSLSAISNEVGVVVERLAYDPWGKRRNLDGSPDTTYTLTSSNTKRGYTLHEHMDEMGVINMNGRVYDPMIGRFMTADSYIQSPFNLKSFNRYSYAWNNPLSNVDPSGFETEDSDGESSDESNDGSYTETSYVDQNGVTVVVATRNPPAYGGDNTESSNGASVSTSSSGGGGGNSNTSTTGGGVNVVSAVSSLGGQPPTTPGESRNPPEGPANRPVLTGNFTMGFTIVNPLANQNKVGLHSPITGKPVDGISLNWGLQIELSADDVRVNLVTSSTDITNAVGMFFSVDQIATAFSVKGRKAGSTPSSESTSDSTGSAVAIGLGRVQTGLSEDTETDMNQTGFGGFAGIGLGVGGYFGKTSTKEVSRNLLGFSFH